MIFKCLKNGLASCLPYKISIGYYLAQAWESPLNLLWLHPDPCGVCGPLTQFKIPCHWLYAIHRLGSADFSLSVLIHEFLYGAIIISLANFPIPSGEMAQENRWVVYFFLSLYLTKWYSFLAKKKKKWVLYSFFWSFLLLNLDNFCCIHV